MSMHEKRRRLEEIIGEHTPMAIAYSGGVDSACLLAVAQRVAGEEILAVIADSPSLPRKALAEAVALARKLGARLEVVETAEMENPEYVENPLNRCYFCKAELFVNMDRLASERGFRSLAYGENADDPASLRPGSRAAAEFKVLAPLREAGLTKAEVRELSREFGLPTAEKPAQPCLSSRIPHGTPVTREALAAVEAAEDAVRELGFRVFRVRYIANGVVPSALVQVAPDEFARLEASRDQVIEAVRQGGFSSVQIDPKGYRSAVPSVSSR